MPGFPGSGFPGPSMGNGLFDAMFTIVPVIVVGMILFMIVRGVTTTVHNLGQELIARPARIIGKRQHTSVHGGGVNNMHAHSSTTYYITFEFENGEREEFRVGRQEYGLLAEGDVGTLRSQGTWFKGFDRSILPG